MYKSATTSISGGEGHVVFREVALAHGADVILRICLSGQVGLQGSQDDHVLEHDAETDHPIAAAIGSAATLDRNLSRSRHH
jgi:hypothetical protein